MKYFKIVLSVMFFLFLISCGDSGGGGAIGRAPGMNAEIDPYWTIDGSGEDEDGPTILNNPITTPSYPCPGCTATSCPEDEPCNCPASPTSPTGPTTTETTELPELQLRVITDFYYSPAEDVDKPLEYCLNISEENSLWWLAYQLTGGLIGYAGLNTPEPTVTTSAGGTTFHYKSTAEDGTDIVLETTHYLTNPRLENGAMVIDQDNTTLTYHHLTYTDPVFGAVAIEKGKITCEGRSIYYLNTQNWYRNHTCSVTGRDVDPVIFFFQAHPYYVNFTLDPKIFRGEANVPENTSFDNDDNPATNNSTISINAERHNLPSLLPDEVDECLNP